MNIPQIRYFVTAAQLQNLSKAAESLHLSQPALSKSIAKLEEELGTPLFVRNGKRIILNQAGQRFLESARVILRNLDGALLDLEEQAAGTIARISIGLCGPDEKISESLAAFAAEHPGIELTINCFIESDDHLDINQYDMLLHPGSSRYNKFWGIPFRKESFLLAIPTIHPLAERKEITPKELEGQPFVFINQQQKYIEEPYFLCSGLNLRIRSMYFTNSREQHRQLIASGLALGFVSEGYSSTYRKTPEIRLLPITGEKFQRQLTLCFKREKHLSAAGKALRSFIMEYFNLSDHDLLEYHFSEQILEKNNRIDLDF